VHRRLQANPVMATAARFDELGAGVAEAPMTPPPVGRIDTAATRWAYRVIDAWQARDWERIARGFAPGCRTMDHRRMAHLELDRGAHLATLRFAFDLRSSLWTAQLLATRGDRLALARWRIEGSDGDAGASELEFLQVHEVDDQGAAIAIVVFDLDDVDAAY